MSVLLVCQINLHLISVHGRVSVKLLMLMFVAHFLKALRLLNKVKDVSKTNHIKLSENEIVQSLELINNSWALNVEILI